MQKAFTLIEMLVVVGVVTIMTSIAFTYYNSFTQSKQLELEAKKMADVLELARKNAGAGYMYRACTSNRSLGGYEVVVQNGTTYSLLQCCADATDACASSFSVNSYKVQSGAVSITSATGPVLFKTLSGGADISGIGNPIIFKTTSASCINVTVSTSGTIIVGSEYTTGC